MDFFDEFPELGRSDLRDFKKAVDLDSAVFRVPTAMHWKVFLIPYYNL